MKIFLNFEIQAYYMELKDLLEQLEKVVAMKSMNLAMKEERKGSTLEDKVREIVYEVLLEVIRSLKVIDNLEND